MIRNTANSFGSVSRALHWIISPLVILMLIVGYFMDDISAQPLKGMVYNIHKLTGILILLLMLIRLVWALNNPKPKSPLGTTTVEHAAEWVGHALLYALIITQPVLGWVGSVVAGHAPHIGSWQLTLPLAENKPLVKWCFEMHNLLAIVIIVVVSLHILAALWHHFIRKDNVLMRMLRG